MKYIGQAPIEDVDQLNSLDWNSIRVIALHPVIQAKIKESTSSKFVMINTRHCIAVLIREVNISTIFYFENI